MIELQCPHCKRVLKVPERFVGTEGACNYCGTRILVRQGHPADAGEGIAGSDESRGQLLETETDLPASVDGLPAAAFETDRAAQPEIATLEAQIAQSRREIERLTQAFETERAARVEAEAAREMLEERYRRLLEQRATPDPPGAAEPPRAGARQELGPASDPGTSQQEPEGRGGGLRVLAALCCVAALLAVGSLWLPQLAPFRATVWSRVARVAERLGVSLQPPPDRRVAPQPALSTGDIEIAVQYAGPHPGQETAVAARQAPLRLGPLKLDRNAFCALLQEAGVPPEVWGPFLDWCWLGEPDTAAAKTFASAEGFDGAPFAEARRQMAALGERLGRDRFVARLRDAVSRPAQQEWIDCMSSDKGVLTIAGLKPGRYLLQHRRYVDSTPNPPPESVNMFDPCVVLIRPGECTHRTVQIVDFPSGIRGNFVDAETGKPLANVSLTLSGEVTDGRDIALVTDEEGAFSVNADAAGYGAFTIQCAALPKRYAAASSFKGRREPGVLLDPIRITASKKGGK